MDNGFLHEFGHAMQFSNGYRHPDTYHHESVPRSFANKSGGGGSSVKTVYTESLVYQGNRAFSHNGCGDQKGRAVKQSNGVSSLEKFLNTKKTTLQVLRPKDIQPSSYPLPTVPFASSLEKKKMVVKKADKELYSRKVFVGGLPIDIREEEVYSTFRPYGKVLVDWPRRQEAVKDGGRSMSGYVFLVFEEEGCVGRLIGDCYEHSGKFYLCVTSPTMHKKPVQVRPWYLSDADYMLDPQLPLDSRLTVFIGGVPRPTKAVDIAEALNRFYGNVAYVGVDTDPELRYPKGCARVTFTNAKGYIAAISGRYVYLNHADVEKRVEIKPYLMEEQMCDECGGNKCHGRYAPYYCGHESCMQYYCEACWDSMHVGETSHCPIVRMGEQTKVLKHPPHHNSNNNRSRSRSYFRG